MFGWFKRKPKRGVLEKIDLTFGGNGNQVMTVDGLDYATWIDSKQWPAIGSTISFEVFYRPDNYSNHKMRCLRLVAST